MKKYIVKDTESGFHEFDYIDEVNAFLTDCGYFHLDEVERKQRFAIYRKV